MPISGVREMGICEHGMLALVSLGISRDSLYTPDCVYFGNILEVTR